ncbi:MAG: hypothetical protein KAT68_01130 [Bacteroidales bacterium]|nr:hypothetical protein [Bacteroidales bacterium]
MENQNSFQKKIDELSQKGYIIDVGNYISRGWDLFQKNMGGFIGFTAIYFIITIAVGIIPFIGVVGNILLSPCLAAGYYLVANKIYKNKNHEFEDFFKGFDYFGNLVLASLITGIFIGIGIVLLIIPGIYLAVAYSFIIPFIIFSKTEFWTAMENSRKLVTRQWFSILGLLIVLFIINILGAIALGVGLLFTVPLTYCTIYIAYEDIVGTEESENKIIEG